MNDSLETARERFLDQLHNPQFDPTGHAQFVAYWTSIESQAQMTEDLSQLDSWHKEIMRDKDRLAELKVRQQQAASSQMGMSPAVQLISRLLALLDDLGGRLRKRLLMIRGEIGMWVFLAGPGKKSKPRPNQTVETKQEKEEQAALLAQKKKEEPTKKMSR